MIMIFQIFALALIMGVVWYLGYHRGKTIKEREMKDMEEPALTPEENKKRQKYFEFCQAFDALMSEENDVKIVDEAELPLDKCEHYCKDDISDFIRASVMDDDDTIDDFMTGDLEKSGLTENNKDIRQ